ncbi:unnamed protein product [Phyllotreta striolata]|uniref:RUN domain-containing protein n=1 Tax=Phyllotreta striolata TaxID=444603 RepID=A0A9N9TWE5_PHYSR|nr:unnamed protein product [Phyllotreta striolata]
MTQCHKDMLIVLLCCIMKILEFSSGSFAPASGGAPTLKRRKRYIRRRKGKGMTEIGIIRGSPDSDCNSNHHGSASYVSNTSSQDIDFIQDNSDYQWFIDYGYRDGASNNHTSILSLPESYEASDLNYYDAFAKNVDANLAEADMESFRTEDIRALLSNLPPMCTDHQSQENSRRGECYASITGSLMAKFELDGSLSGRDSSQGDEYSAGSNSMSICKSELLFSPVKETVLPVNFSVDSLDSDFHDMMLTCQANKDNYTIAFEGSVTTYSEDGDCSEKDKNARNRNSESARWSSNNANNRPRSPVDGLDDSMTRSEDSNSLTTWSKLKKTSGEEARRHPSGNNNNSESDSAARLHVDDATSKSRSLPNLSKQKEKSGAGKEHSDSSVSDRLRWFEGGDTVRVFDIQHHTNSSNSGSVSEMATSVDMSFSDNTNNKPNFSLVKLFMKQKSMSVEGMSTTMDQLSSTENWPASQSGESSGSVSKEIVKDFTKTCNSITEEPEEETPQPIAAQIQSDPPSKNINNNNNSVEKPAGAHVVMNRSIQTSHFSEITNLKNANKTCTEAACKRSVKILEPSFLRKLKSEGETKKPVYVLYPNYVLPNLDFLSDQDVPPELLLVPQKPPETVSTKRRPFSFNDIESLKQRGFGHVKDWDSLNFLLPQEYRNILSEANHQEHIRRSASIKNKFAKKRPLSCDANQSSGSSINTQPSSGYRGSSSLLSESQTSPLFVYRYDSATSSDASFAEKHRHRVGKFAAADQKKTAESCKRCNTYETSEEEIADDVKYKRKSLQDPPYANRFKRFSETEDEGVDAGTSSSSLDENPDYPKNITASELAQLEEFLKLSGISSSDNEELNEKSLGQLKSYVGKFLALKMNQEDHLTGRKSATIGLPKHFMTPNNSPNISAFVQQRHYQTKKLTDMPITEENENSPISYSRQTTPVHLNKHLSDNLVQKRSLIVSLTDSVEQVMHHFSLASNQIELNTLGDSNSNPACAKLLLSTLCPALYAVLSDGLKPSLETNFGAINNSVWQVVEASAQQGPLTNALNELVMRINGEDAVTEGLVKFNAFVFGLLNVRSLDAWTSYLRTRESVLKKHYTADSLLVLSHTGGADVRGLLDAMVAALRPLAFLPFQLDLLFEFKELHRSFKRMDTYQQLYSPTHKRTPSPSFKHFHRSESDDASSKTVKHFDDSPSRCHGKSGKERPRSCIETNVSHPTFKLGEDADDSTRKRWSGIALSSKLYQAYHRLTKEEEEYVDSLENANQDKSEDNSNTVENVPSLAEDLEPESLDSNGADKPINARRFKKLQKKWEMLSTQNSTESPPLSPTHAPKSKIPRPISSPVKPSGIPVLVKKLPSPTGVKTTPVKCSNSVKNSPAKRSAPITRTSRMDQASEATRHAQRPSSLPYKAPQNGKVTKTTPPRRAVSSSLNRKPLSDTKVPKVVRAIGRRLASESGHLAYNDGDRLRVVLEVDEKWLLCCKGTQKGLVPRSGVIADNGRF